MPSRLKCHQQILPAAASWHTDMEGKGSDSNPRAASLFRVSVASTRLLESSRFQAGLQNLTCFPPCKQPLGTSSILPCPLGKPTEYSNTPCARPRPVWQCGGASVTLVTSESRLQVFKCFVQTCRRHVSPSTSACSSHSSLILRSTL